MQQQQHRNALQPLSLQQVQNLSGRRKQFQGLPEPTAQEIGDFRMRLPAAWRGKYSDVQIREVLMTQKQQDSYKTTQAQQTTREQQQQQQQQQALRDQAHRLQQQQQQLQQQQQAQYELFLQQQRHSQSNDTNKSFRGTSWHN